MLSCLIASHTKASHPSPSKSEARPEIHTARACKVWIEETPRQRAFRVWHWFQNNPLSACTFSLLQSFARAKIILVWHTITLAFTGMAQMPKYLTSTVYPFNQDKAGYFWGQDHLHHGPNQNSVNSFGSRYINSGEARPPPPTPTPPWKELEKKVAIHVQVSGECTKTVCLGLAYNPTSKQIITKNMNTLPCKPRKKPSRNSATWLHTDRVIGLKTFIWQIVG